MFIFLFISFPIHTNHTRDLHLQKFYTSYHFHFAYKSHHNTPDPEVPTFPEILKDIKTPTTVIPRTPPPCVSITV